MTFYDFYRIWDYNTTEPMCPCIKCTISYYFQRFRQRYFFKISAMFKSIMLNSCNTFRNYNSSDSISFIIPREIPKIHFSFPLKL